MGYLLAQSDISVHCPVTLTGAVAHVLDRFAPEPVRNATTCRRLTRMDGKALPPAAPGSPRSRAAATSARRRTVARRTNEGIRRSAGSSGSPATSTAGSRSPSPGLRARAGGGGGLGLYLVPACSSRRGAQPLPDQAAEGEARHPRPRHRARSSWRSAHAVEVAPPPDGLKTMMAALGYSRIHNAMASAGIQRRAFAEALAHAETRRSLRPSSRRLPDGAGSARRDACVRVEASVALAFAAARAFDAAQSDTGGAALDARSSPRSPSTSRRNGQSPPRAAPSRSWAATATQRNIPTARLYRDAQVLTVWEGPPNIQALRGAAACGRGLAGARGLPCAGSTPFSTCPSSPTIRPWCGRACSSSRPCVRPLR